MKLSILIPSTPDRFEFLTRLFDQFNKQAHYEIDKRVHTFYNGNNWNVYPYTFRSYSDIEIIVYEDAKTNSIGHKRNWLLSHSNCEYVAFIDSDDRISDNYFKLLFEGIEKGVDCCSLKGIITEDGKNPQVFEHSIKYKEYLTNCDNEPVRYERYPNHLNCIKASIAKQFKFPEVNHGEDTDWATQIHKSGLLKTEHYIPQIIYYYDYRSKK